MGFGSFLGGVGKGAADIADDARKTKIKQAEDKQHYDLMMRNNMLGVQQQRAFKQEDIAQEEARLRDPTRAAAIAHAKLAGETVLAEGKSAFETKDIIAKGNNVDYLDSLRNIDESSNAAKLQTSKDDIKRAELAANATIESARLRGRVGGASGYTPAQLQKMQDDIDENIPPGPQHDAAMAQLFNDGSAGVVYNPKASTQSKVMQYAPIVEQASKVTGVPVPLTLAHIMVESGGKVDAKNPSGASGLGQIMPENFKNLNITDPFDPNQNIAGMSKLQAELLQRYKRYGEYSTELAIAAYNSRPATVDKAIRAASEKGLPPSFDNIKDYGIPSETKAYVPKVLAAQALVSKMMNGETSPTATNEVPPLHPKMEASILSELKDKDNVGPRLDAISDAIRMGGMSKSRAIATFIDAEWDPKQGVFIRDGKPIIVKNAGAGGGDINGAFNALNAKQVAAGTNVMPPKTLADAQAVMPPRNIAAPVHADNQDRSLAALPAKALDKLKAFHMPDAYEIDSYLKGK